MRVAPEANSAFCASKISWNLFIGALPRIRLQSARFDRVDGGVVPVTVQARYFTVRVIADNVRMGDAIDLALLYDARDVGRHRPAKQCLHRDGVVFAFDQFDDLDPEVRHRLREAAPDCFKAAPDRHGAVLAVRKVPSLCAVSAKRQHALDIMSVIGGEKPFGDRVQIWVVAHKTSIGAGGAAYVTVRT